jgi:hypothetical protein
LSGQAQILTRLALMQAEQGASVLRQGERDFYYVPVLKKRFFFQKVNCQKRLVILAFASSFHNKQQ